MLDVTDPRRIPRRPRFRDRRTAVGGSVVDENQLPIVETRLVYDTAYGLVDEGRAVEEDEDARDLRDPRRAHTSQGRRLAGDSPRVHSAADRAGRRSVDEGNPNCKTRSGRP